MQDTQRDINSFYDVADAVEILVDCATASAGGNRSPIHPASRLFAIASLIEHDTRGPLGFTPIGPRALLNLIATDRAENLDVRQAARDAAGKMTPLVRRYGLVAGRDINR